MEAGGDRHGVSTTQKSTDVKTTRLENLTKLMSGWKEFLILAQRIALWEKSYYGYCIVGAVTTIYLLWWWMNVSVLSSLAIIMFLVAVADYGVPQIGHRLPFGQSWEGEQERQYELACQRLLNLQDSMVSSWQRVQQWKITYPKSYMACVSSVLFLLGLLGYAINNTFIVYVLVLALCLTPGAHHRGFIQSYCGTACQKVQAVLSRKPKPKDE